MLFVKEDQVRIALSGLPEDDIEAAVKIAIKFCKKVFLLRECMSFPEAVNSFVVTTAFLAYKKKYKIRGTTEQRDFIVKSDFYNELVEAAKTHAPLQIKKGSILIGEKRDPDEKDIKAARKKNVTLPDSEDDFLTARGSEKLNYSFDDDLDIHGEDSTEEIECLMYMSSAEKKIIRMCEDGISVEYLVRNLDLSNQEAKMIINQIRQKARMSF